MFGKRHEEKINKRIHVGLHTYVVVQREERSEVCCLLLHTGGLGKPEHPVSRKSVCGVGLGDGWRERQVMEANIRIIDITCFSLAENIYLYLTWRQKRDYYRGERENRKAEGRKGNCQYGHFIKAYHILKCHNETHYL